MIMSNDPHQKVRAEHLKRDAYRSASLGIAQELSAEKTASSR
jgi:hypothetical protein